jgi:hypothetical protein
MKRTLFLSLLITWLILISQAAFADGLQMLSQTYHTANHDYAITSTDGTPITDSYYEEIPADMYGEKGLTYAYESVSMFHFIAEADIVKSNFIQSRAIASASGDWHFSPLYDNLSINLCFEG